VDAFDREWNRLAKLGKCDGYGGMEYTRVRRYFDGLKDKPKDVKGIEALIVKQANLGPNDKHSGKASFPAASTVCRTEV